MSLIKMMVVMCSVAAISKSFGLLRVLLFYCQAEDGIRHLTVTGVQTCALPISSAFDVQGADDGHRPGRADAVDVAEGDVHPLVAGEVDACDPCHPVVPPSDLALALLVPRSEEHTSELQSQSNLVCRLLLEKKNE